MLCGDAQPLLFFRSTINFAHPRESQLEKLAKACQPATFGHNREDVLDETYRKAGKLDATDFSVQFSPADLGIVEKVYSHLLRGADHQPIHAELYKLNVYGKSRVPLSSVGLIGYQVLVLFSKHMSILLVVTTCLDRSLSYSLLYTKEGP